MMAHTPTYALIHQAALNVRHDPDHRSELTSQLLLGEDVAVHDSARREWWHIENLADGYCGWARTWGLKGVSRRALAEWTGSATARVRVLFSEAHMSANGDGRLGPLFWNARVAPGRARGKFREIKLPDGGRGVVSRRDLALAGEAPPPLDERVRSLLGTPYLWGGRTPLGIDCSGFSQQLLSEQGQWLPRDADQQYRATRPLRPEEPAKAGDLVFFGPPDGPIGHVGVLLGPEIYAHSRGTVHLSSLSSPNNMWEKELESQFRGVRRPSSAPGPTG